MAKKLIINADDLGLSLGVNYAILKANTEGFLSHASLMANTECFKDAIENVIPNCKNLKIGVHINLTCAKALFPNTILTEKGILNNTFLTLLFKYKSRKVLKSIETEIELQILKIINMGIEISHIDGHEHIHVIPSINKIVRKLAKKHGIPRIREINENFIESWKYNGEEASISNVIKLLLLKFLSFFNTNKNDIGFYSMLNTCEINGKNLFKFLQKTNSYETIEVMLHPALSDLDSPEYFQTLAPRFVTFLQNSHRKSEFDLCFDKNFESYEILNSSSK